MPFRTAGEHSSEYNDFLSVARFYEILIFPSWVLEKFSKFPPSDNSFTTAASPAENVSRVERTDDEVFATPRKSRKRWSTSLASDFTFAQEAGSPANLTPANLKPADSSTEIPTAEAPTVEDGDGGSPLEEACQADTTAVAPKAD